jgi:sugar phosphate isomerase/epimerase
MIVAAIRFTPTSHLITEIRMPHDDQSHDSGGATRRTFLKDLAVLGAGSWVFAACARATTSSTTTTSSAARVFSAVKPTADHVGIQLFTVRDQMTADFDGTLAKIAEIGYREVEFFSYGDRTPAQVRATLDRVGLRAPSTHAALHLGPDLEKQLAGYQAMGHQYSAAGGPVFGRRPGGPGGPGGPGAGGPPGAPGGAPAGAPPAGGPPAGGPPGPGAGRPPAPPQTPDSVHRQIDEWNQIAAAAKPYGIKVLVHNHTMEFQPFADGRTPFDLMIAELDPERVVLELDIGWATVAGKSALDLFAKYPGRFPLWHVKDMAGLAALQGLTNQGERQRAAKIVPVGQGEIDYKPIFARAAEAGLQHFFVEQDTAPNSGDSIAAARTSFETIRKTLA